MWQFQPFARCGGVAGPAVVFGGKGGVERSLNETDGVRREEQADSCDVISVLFVRLHLERNWRRHSSEVARHRTREGERAERLRPGWPTATTDYTVELARFTRRTYLHVNTKSLGADSPRTPVPLGPLCGTSSTAPLRSRRVGRKGLRPCPYLTCCRSSAA